MKGMPGVITPIFASIKGISQRFLALIGGNRNRVKKNTARKNAKTVAQKPLAKQPPRQSQLLFQLFSE